MVLRVKNNKFEEFTILLVVLLCLSLKRKNKKPPKRLLSILFTEPVLVEFTKRNGVLNRVIYVTHNSNGFKVEQSRTQTITGLSGIRCLNSNMVLVKNFLNPKNSGEKSLEKQFSIWKPRGAERIECLLIYNIYTFSAEGLSIVHRFIKSIVYIKYS